MDAETINGYLTVAGAAQRLGVKPARVRQLLQDGTLPRSRWLRNVVLICADAVERHVEQRRRPGRPRKPAKGAADAR